MQLSRYKDKLRQQRCRLSIPWNARRTTATHWLLSLQRRRFASPPSSQPLYSSPLFRRKCVRDGNSRQDVLNKLTETLYHSSDQQMHVLAHISVQCLATLFWDWLTWYQTFLGVILGRTASNNECSTCIVCTIATDDLVMWCVCLLRGWLCKTAERIDIMLRVETFVLGTLYYAGVPILIMWGRGNWGKFCLL